MKKLVVKGGNKLKGEVNISGAKNAALPIFIASLLTKKKLILQNVPHVTDIANIVDLLSVLGVKLTFDASKDKGCCKGRAVILDGSGVNSFIAPYEIVKKMRASFLVLGPLLARFGKAQVSLPGGCAIGKRPVDIHLKAFEDMGAEIKIENGYINAEAKNGLKGADIDFRFPSVGATQNVMMAATLAKGATVITNAAKEPEIIDLANCLNGMGAKITGAGTSVIRIDGVKELKDYTHCILGDRIEAATYLIAAAMTDGEIILNGIDIFSTFGNVIDSLEDAGIKLEKLSDTSVKVSRKPEGIKASKIMTDVFPGFSTDVQAQFMALMLVADGESIISENIYENRFMHVPELQRLGANIEANGSIAIVKSGSELSGAEVMATDLRASVSLVLAGLVSKGKTVVNRVYHLDRGYDHLAEKLCRCGADIEVVYCSDENE